MSATRPALWVRLRRTRATRTDRVHQILRATDPLGPQLGNRAIR